MASILVVSSLLISRNPLNSLQCLLSLYQNPRTQLHAQNLLSSQGSSSACYSTLTVNLPGPCAIQSASFPSAPCLLHKLSCKCMSCLPESLILPSLVEVPRRLILTGHQSLTCPCPPILYPPVTVLSHLCMLLSPKLQPTMKLAIMVNSEPVVVYFSLPIFMSSPMSHCFLPLGKYPLPRCVPT